MRYEISSKDRFDTGLKELWRYRELLYMLAYRDFKIRYAQTILGVLWTFIQPIVTLGILTLVFHFAVKVETPIPYILFALTGIWCWSYFSYVMVQGGNSIIGAQSIVTKIYFPRILVPLGKSLFGLIDFGITFLFIVIVMLWLGYAPSPNVVFLPLFVGQLLVLSTSTAIGISALTTRYRDIQHVIPFLAQIGLYLTPVGYPATIIPKKFEVLYYCNPMVGIIEGVRWSITGNGTLPVLSIVLSNSITLILFLSSFYYFKRMENSLADIV